MKAHDYRGARQIRQDIVAFTANFLFLFVECINCFKVKILSKPHNILDTCCLMILDVTFYENVCLLF